MKRLFTGSMIGLFCMRCFADVNLRHGNFEVGQLDWKIQEGPNPFYVFRNYDSRNGFKGVFGPGWCAQFEKEIHTDTSGKFSVTNCGLPEKNIAGQLPIKTSDGFQRQLFDGAMESYDEDGRLVSVNTKNNSVRYFYNSSGQLERLSDGSAHELKVSYGLEGHPTQITYNKQVVARYEFKKNLLDKVLLEKNKTIDYEYGSKSQLVKLIWPDGKSTEISYDPSTGKVTQFKSRQACLEIYDYKKPVHVNANIESEVALSKKCASEKVSRETYRSSMQRNDDNLLFVVKESRSAQGKNLNYQYAANSPQPTAIQLDNQQLLKQNFDAQGRLQSRETNDTKMFITYQADSQKMAAMKIEQSFEFNHRTTQNEIKYTFGNLGELNRVDIDDPTSANHPDHFVVKYSKAGIFEKIISSSGREMSFQIFPDGRKKSLVAKLAGRTSVIAYNYDSAKNLIGLEPKFYKDPQKAQAVDDYLHFEQAVLPVMGYL